MPKLTLSAAFSRNPMTEAVHDERVAPDGVSWTVSDLHPSEMFWRQLRFAEFDISKMSLSSLAISTAKGDRTWVAIPVFTTRRFFHTGIMVREDAGIEAPADLAGKRVGVPEYQQTAAVWTRGALDHEFGVSPVSMHWHMERPPEMSHGGATAFEPPPGIELEYIPTSSSIGAMLSSAKLDAAIVYIAADNLVDRSRQAADRLARVRPLFADQLAEGVRYYEKTGILPVNHCVVIRASLVEQHPWRPGVHRALPTRGRQRRHGGNYIDDVEPGSVIVLGNAGRVDATVWGDILTYVAHHRGVAGTVIDGVSRDSDRSLELGYPLFTRSTWMRTGKDRVQMVGMQVPVSAGGVRVRPGDIVIGDGDGVVVVPTERASDVLDVAAGIEQAEDKIREMVRQGSRLDEARAKANYFSLQTRAGR